MNKKAEKWWKENKSELFSPDKMDFDKIWHAATERAKSYCHDVDEFYRPENAKEQYGCLLSKLVFGVYLICNYDMGVKCAVHESKTGCHYWRPIDER